MPSRVPCRMVFAVVLCRVMWPNQESLHRFTDSNKGSCFVFSIRNVVEPPSAWCLCQVSMPGVYVRCLCQVSMPGEIKAPTQGVNV